MNYNRLKKQNDFRTEKKSQNNLLTLISMKISMHRVFITRSEKCKWNECT